MKWTLSLVLVSLAFCAVAAEKRVLPKGLVASYSFDTTLDGGWTPCKVDTNNNAKVSGTRWTQGWNRSAYYLNGKSALITIKDGKHLEMSRFTIALHFKGYKITDDNLVILDKGSYSGYILSMLGSEDDQGRDKGKICFEVQGKRCLSDKPLNDNAWYNVIITVDEKYARMYIDGKLQKDVAVVKKAFTPVDDDLIIGARQDQVFEKKNRKKRLGFEGSVDEMMIFNRALGQAEVEDAFYCSIPHYNKSQVQGRKRDIDELLERKLITEDFHARKMKELNMN